MFAILLSVVISSCSMGQSLEDTGHEKHVSTLCDVLGKIETGEEDDVTVRGTYLEGPETHVLYSTECDGRFQPATWVDFSEPTIGMEKLPAALATSGRADVVLRGTLYGPRAISSNGSDPLAEATQLSRRRYGHLGLFRTKFVVHEIVSAKGTTATAPPETFAPRPTLRVLHAEMPLYPTAARMADLSGEVQLEVEVKGGVVASVRNLRGSLLLGKAASENVQSWKFASGMSGKMSVTYVFRLVDESSLTGTRVEADLPSHVTITEPRSRW